MAGKGREKQDTRAKNYDAIVKLHNAEDKLENLPCVALLNKGITLVVASRFKLIF